MNLFTMGIIWIITILITYGIEIHFVISILKDMADNDYKLNLKNVEEINDQLDSSIVNLSKIGTLIPFLNLFLELRRANLYIKERENLIYFLRTTNILESMSPEESNKYNKRPTGLQALKMYVDEISKINFIKLEDGSKIYFYYPNEEEKDLENIIITKAEGPAERLSKDEQKQEIIKTVQAKLDKVLEKYTKKEVTITTINPQQSASKENTNYNFDTPINNYEEIVKDDNQEEEKGKQKTLTKNNKNRF